MSDRNLRFVKRVNCERTALAAVNSAFRQAPPLAALSEPAVERWRTGASGKAPEELLDQVQRRLIEIGRRLDIQTDNSREVFDGAVSTKSATSALEELYAICSEFEPSDL